MASFDPHFGLINEIDVDDEASWKGRIFLSFDVDWAHDDVITDTLSLLEGHAVPATWFITHQSPAVQRLVGSGRHQVGIHPNFNPLLGGDLTAGTNAGDVLSVLHDLAPSAKAVRSHSLTQSERLVDLFISRGITHASNVFIPFNRISRLTPWRLWGGLTVVPHCWQDNVAMKMALNIPTLEDARESLIIFNFHPIHVFLNSEEVERYERTRHLHQTPGEMIKHRYEGEGTRSSLMKVLNFGRNGSFCKEDRQ
ncbi:MAG: hypothetical protein H0W47_05405 [Polaromonas sp.]|uniref:polysaccharide deacetylase WbmS family protein n=1 Tax=Polaromonas sp. TaxID=1869339 RepID=UPI0017F6AFB5|nr:hypothetical protein [Polaromonas sp.]MBA3593218.1 hypothetical protein [Polaromonas sp.]